MATAIKLLPSNHFFFFYTSERIFFAKTDLIQQLKAKFSSQFIINSNLNYCLATTSFILGIIIDITVLPWI